MKPSSMNLSARQTHDENQMTPSTEQDKQRPTLALAIATALGVGYAPNAPGTFGSLVGVVTAMVTSLFFLRPHSVGDLFSRQRLMERTLMDHHFLVPGADIHDAPLAIPVICAILLVLFLALVGVWSAGKTARFAGIKDPQFVVIDEVAGQHITLILPLIPLAMPNLASHMDFSTYAIYAALSLLNWKYLLAGFLLFRLFDICKPVPIRNLEKLPGGWGIMADDWLAGIYAAIVLKVALLFGLFALHFNLS
jgi:phosphatidylglycerophosphatase A